MKKTAAEILVWPKVKQKGVCKMGRR
jgi:hypothetical protein